jgi:hypothetical protein
MLRRIAGLAGALALLLASLAARPKPAKDPVFERIESTVKTLSDLSGFTEKHAVPYGRMTKAQLRQFLKKRIKRTVKPQEIQADELALKMFGLVPQDFDLKQSTIDLLTEQAAAFYDYDQKRLFLLVNSTIEDESTTLAHELAHALADQYFDLERFVDNVSANDDENLAHTAVVEGEASWLMLAYQLKELGRAPNPTPEMLNALGQTSKESAADFPVLENSPLYIQDSLLFPYTQGTLFFDAVYHRFGKAAFSRVFAQPPIDSAQILHPDLYFSHAKAIEPGLPEAHFEEATTEITQGSLGEFDHLTLLKQYVGEEKARALAAHLRGGKFQIVGVGKRHNPVLKYASEWDDGAHAEEFLEAYREVLHQKWKHCSLTSTSKYEVTGTGDNGYFVTKVSSNRVTSVEGIESVTAWKRMTSPAAVQPTVH